MADFGGGVCANRILLAYEQDLPALDDRSAAVVEIVGGVRHGYLRHLAAVIEPRLDPQHKSEIISPKPQFACGCSLSPSDEASYI
jgi:hypothetical protein